MKHKSRWWEWGILLLIFISAAPFSYSASYNIQENAEDGDITGWSVFDNRPKGEITNIIDPENSENRVIQLLGKGLRTGYKFSFPNEIEKLYNLQMEVKFSEPFVIYVKCHTTRGRKVLSYYSGIKKIRRWRRISYRLPEETIDGQWHTILRDLQKDLQNSYKRQVRILAVEALLIRGSGLIDDIAFREYDDADHDLIPDSVEDAVGLDKNNPDDAAFDLDHDKLSNLQEFILGTEINSADSDNDNLTDFFELKLSKTSPFLQDSDKNGIKDSGEDSDQDKLKHQDEQNSGMNPHVKAELDKVYDFYLLEQTVREDAESGNTNKWSVPKTRKIIKNIVDPSDLQNRLIRFKRNPSKPFLLKFKSPELSQFKLQWDMEINPPFIIFAKCTTTQGGKILYYTGTKDDWLEKDKYIHHGLGNEIKTGERVTIHRDLQRDLNDALPDCQIISFDSFGVLGRGYIDNVITSAYADQDHDLIPDSVEDAAGLQKDNPNDAFGDVDDDGVDNLTEFYAGTLELSNLNDEDHDGLDDDWEMKFFGNLDQDANGDFDGDGLTNLQEMNHGTDPTKTDTDGDGMSDADEIAAGRDPLNPDEDSDGLPDGWEMKYFGNLDQTPDGDPDNDKVNNITEYKYGRHPNAGARQDRENKMKLHISTPIK